MIFLPVGSFTGLERVEVGFCFGFFLPLHVSIEFFPFLE